MWFVRRGMRTACLSARKSPPSRFYRDADDGRCGSGAWSRAAHVERARAGGARDGMWIVNTVFGGTAVDSTWSNDSYPNEPYARLFRADLTGGVRLVNVVPCRHGVSSALEAARHSGCEDHPRWPNQPGRGIYSSMMPRFRPMIAACVRSLASSFASVRVNFTALEIRLTKATRSMERSP